MFKKLCILFLVLVLIIGFVSSARLIDPISKQISGEEYLGSVSPGATLELIFSKELGKFSSLEVTNKSPSGFNVTVKDYIESIKVFVDVPENAVPDTYSLKITLNGKVVENIDTYFVVEKELLDVSLNNYSVDTTVGSPATYIFTLINDSHADDEFVLENSLPWYWLNKKGIFGYPLISNKITVIVPRKSTKEVSISVFPQVYGEKIFNVKTLMSPGEEKEFSLRVNASQTFKSKTQNIFYGIPFYSFSLLPSFDLIGLFSLLFN